VRRETKAERPARVIQGEPRPVAPRPVEPRPVEPRPVARREAESLRRAVCPRPHRLPHQARALAPRGAPRPARAGLAEVDGVVARQPRGKMR
jgi:hypothetical protein